MKGKRISCHEAAGILGTTTQNVRLLAANGIISSIKVVTEGGKKTVYYFKNEILKRKKATKEYLSRAIEAADLDELGKRLLKQAKDNEEAIRKRYKSGISWMATQARIAEIILTLLHSSCERLTFEETKILKDFIRLTPIDKIAAAHGVSHTRISQITSRACRLLKRGSCMAQKYDAALEDIREKDRTIHELRERLTDCQKRLSAADSGDPTYAETNRRLRQNISDMCLSVRSYNVLRFANIQTMADIVCHSRQQFLRLPNCGRKSVREIELTVERANLHFDMIPEDFGVERSSNMII